MTDRTIEVVEEELSRLVGDKCRLRIYIGKEWTNLKVDYLHFVKNSSVGQPFRLEISDKATISKFSLLEMPGCCGICISTGAYIDSKYRNMGINTILNSLRIKIAKELGYTVLLCTDVATNVYQKKVLQKNGWQDIFRFRNRRTNNLVDISVVHL
jgi:hypothetical protein